MSHLKHEGTFHLRVTRESIIIIQLLMQKLKNDDFSLGRGGLVSHSSRTGG